MSAAQDSNGNCDPEATEMLFPVFCAEIDFRMLNDENMYICDTYV